MIIDYRLHGEFNVQTHIDTHGYVYLTTKSKVSNEYISELKGLYKIL